MSEQCGSGEGGVDPIHMNCCCMVYKVMVLKKKSRGAIKSQLRWVPWICYLFIWTVDLFVILLLCSFGLC